MRRSTLVVAAVTGSLLLVPLIAMRFTDEVAWSPADFLAAACLLSGAGMGMVIGTRHLGTRAARVAVIVAIAAGLLAVWAELAVGLFT